MIKNEVPDIDTNKYIYETELTFAKDFGEKLLNKILIEGDSCLELRKKYIHPKHNFEDLANHPELLADKEKAMRFYKRCLQITRKFADQEPIDFKQYFMSPELTKEFFDLVPLWLKEIAPVVKDDNSRPYGSIPTWIREIVPGEPLPGVQISQLGDFLSPHRGHPRKSSLFMLLQGNSEQTRWYRETAPFEIFDFFRVPDLNKIEHVVSAEIQPFKWYVFNHQEWHSVHRFSSGKRINMGIDFDCITAKDLIELTKKHGNG
jgi:hypothetical protein